MTKRLSQRSMETQGPFPELPLPTRFQKIKKTKPKPAGPEIAAKPVIKPEPPKPAPAPAPATKPKPKPKPRTTSPMGGIIVPEPIIGGELEPEPPTKLDKGDHTIEDLDYGDYQ